MPPFAPPKCSDLMVFYKYDDDDADNDDDDYYYIITRSETKYGRETRPDVLRLNERQSRQIFGFGATMDFYREFSFLDKKKHASL